MKYSPKTVKEICDRIEQGDTQKDAAILSGIEERTFYLWIEKYSNFSDELKKATANYKSKLIKRIQKASDTSWQAGAWILERRFKEEYALNQDPPPQPLTQINFNLAVLSKGELLKLDETINKATPKSITGSG